jgi:hypothetical protein
MTRDWTRLLALVLLVVVGSALAACGGDEHKDHKDHQDHQGSSGSSK